MKILIAIFVIIICAQSAKAQSATEPTPFNWSLLSGLWAESSEQKFACQSDNLHFRFVVSEDKKRLTFKLDRKWRIGTGKEVEEYGADIRSAEGRIMVIRYDKSLGELSPEMSEWEILFIGPGVYRWRSTSWRLNQYNNVIGVKCGQ